MVARLILSRSIKAPLEVDVQGAIGLPAQPQPREFHHRRSHASVGVLACSRSLPPLENGVPASGGSYRSRATPLRSSCSPSSQTVSKDVLHKDSETQLPHARHSLFWTCFRYYSQCTGSGGQPWAGQVRGEGIADGRKIAEPDFIQLAVGGLQPDDLQDRAGRFLDQNPLLNHRVRQARC